MIHARLDIQAANAGDRLAKQGEFYFAVGIGDAMRRQQAAEQINFGTLDRLVLGDDKKLGRQCTAGGGQAVADQFGLQIIDIQQLQILIAFNDQLPLRLQREGRGLFVCHARHQHATTACHAGRESTDGLFGANAINDIDIGTVTQCLFDH